MRLPICALALVLAAPASALASDEGDAPSKDTPAKEAQYRDLHRIEPPHEWPEVSPTTKKRAKKLVNWPGNLGEQYGLDGSVSTRGQTRDEKTGRVEPSDSHR